MGRIMFSSWSNSSFKQQRVSTTIWRKWSKRREKLAICPQNLLSVNSLAIAYRKLFCKYCKALLEKSSLTINITEGQSKWMTKEICSSQLVRDTNGAGSSQEIPKWQMTNREKTKTLFFVKPFKDTEKSWKTLEDGMKSISLIQAHGIILNLLRHFTKHGQCHFN